MFTGDNFSSLYFDSFQTDETPIMAPRNPEQEKEILQVWMSVLTWWSDACWHYFVDQWIEAVLDEKLPEGDFADVLQNGVVLCRLMNKLQPESIKKIKEKVNI